MATDKKYKLTRESITIDNHTLYRIQAVRNFEGVKKGDLGGFVETESNLSHDGNCWVNKNAQVFANARVYNDAWVCDYARIDGNAWVFGNAHIDRTAWVSENARVSENTNIRGDAHIAGNAEVLGHAYIGGSAQVYGNVLLDERILITGDSLIYGNAIIKGRISISQNSEIHGDAILNVIYNHHYDLTVSVDHGHWTHIIEEHDKIYLISNTLHKLKISK